MPVLFLDFDRTLFDTEQFYEWLGEDHFARIMDLESGKLTPPDYRKWLYPDTLPFLNEAKKTHQLVLLSYAMNTLLQQHKIEGSGIASFFSHIIITQREKGTEAKAYLAHKGDPPGPHVFVDDVPMNFSEIKETNLELVCIRIERIPLAWEKMAGVKHEPDHVVHDLDEALQILRKLSLEKHREK